MTCAEPLLGVGCYGNCLYSTCRRDILLDRTDGSRVDDWGKEILGGAWLMGNMGLGKLSSSSHKVFFFSFFLSVFPSSFFILEQPVSFVGLIFITGSNEGCGMRMNALKRLTQRCVHCYPISNSGYRRFRSLPAIVCLCMNRPFTGTVHTASTPLLQFLSSKIRTFRRFDVLRSFGSGPLWVRFRPTQLREDPAGLPYCSEDSRSLLLVSHYRR